jgi:hypothetical protein
MAIMSEIEVLKEFFKRYNRNPLGWKMYQGVSPTGNPELLINHSKYGYLIKRDGYSGMPGIGGRIEERLDLKLGTEQSGLRPIPRYAMKKMIAMIDEEAEPTEIIKILEAILSQPPVTFNELKRVRPPVVIQGPISHSHRPVQSVVGRQLELDAKLELELEKLKRIRTARIL